MRIQVSTSLAIIPLAVLRYPGSGYASDISQIPDLLDAYVSNSIV